VIDFRRHISIFLACSLLIVALLSAPKIEINLASFPTQEEISSGDQLKLYGCTKNELTSSQQNIDLSLKEKKTIKFLSIGIAHFGVLPIVVKNYTAKGLIIISNVIQKALKKLIFPFHTFW
jgi:hypothetical protein